MESSFKKLTNCETIKDSWRSIAGQSASSVFQSFEWCHCWQKVNKDNVVYLTDLTSIIPLTIKKKFFLKYAEITADIISDYQLPITSTKINLKEALSALDIDYFFIRNFPESAFDDIEIDNCAYISKQPYRAHKLTLNPEIDFSKTQKNFRKKTLSDIARQEKRLKAQGELKFSIVDLKPGIVDFYLNTLIRDKEERLKSWKVPSLFSDSRYKTFYKLILQNCNDNDEEFKLHLSQLTLNGEIIASHLGFIHKKIFYYYMPTFNQTYSNLSPGKILLFRLIEWCHTNRISVFDFTIGDESYKKEWANIHQDIYEIFIPLSAKGYIHLFLTKTRSKLKSIKSVRKFVLKLKYIYEKIKRKFP